MSKRYVPASLRGVMSSTTSSIDSTPQPSQPQPSQQPQQPQQQHLSTLVNTSLPMKLAPRLEPQTMSALLSNGQPRTAHAHAPTSTPTSTSYMTSRTTGKPPSAAEFPELGKPTTPVTTPPVTTWTGKNFAALAKGWAQAEEEAREAAKKAAEEQAREEADQRSIQAKHMKELTALKTLHTQSRISSYGFEEDSEDDD